MRSMFHTAGDVADDDTTGEPVHGRRKLRGIAIAAMAIGALTLTALPAHGTARDGSRSPASTTEERHDPEHILVAFGRDVPPSSRAQAHRAEGGSVVNTFEWMNVDVVRIARSTDPVSASARYERNPVVAYAHPNWEVTLLNTPNDTLFNDEWGLHNTGQAVTASLDTGVDDADIDAPEAWAAAFGAGSFPSTGGTRVGILDTGIDLGHVDLLGKTKACANALTATGIVVEGSCSDDNLHGTHVAGTVAAITNNGIGVAGVAPNAELAVFKALNSAGSGFYADVIAGIHWLHTKGGAKVINMSIGGPQDDALDAELSEASAAGTLLIAAAGNDGDDTKNWPAYHTDVVSVAATDAADKRASFSNCNIDVEVAAPGKNVWSTVPGNGYASLNGTSMATPHASGVAAMIMWTQGLDAARTRSVLTGSADDLGAAGRDDCFGYGRVNLAAAVGGSSTPPPPQDPGAIAGTVRDASSKKGISGAVVDCRSAGSTATATDGSYRIDPVPVGSYTCTASATGYRSKSQNVDVRSAQTSTADFALRKKR